MALRTNDGIIVIVSGDSRCGKTAQTMRMVKQLPRILAWDVEADQWSKMRGYKVARGPAELLRLIKANANKIAYIPPNDDLLEEFDFFCECAYYWGRFGGGGAVIFEEFADVSNPSKATKHCGIIVRRGLKRGISIFAISQRWSEASKTPFGNASKFVVFAQASADDAEYMAKKTRIPIEQINELRRFEFIEYDKNTREAVKKRLPFK